jgi:hypothetical protein
VDNIDASELRLCWSKRGLFEVQGSIFTTDGSPNLQNCSNQKPPTAADSMAPDSTVNGGTVRLGNT